MKVTKLFCLQFLTYQNNVFCIFMGFCFLKEILMKYITNIRTPYVVFFLLIWTFSNAVQVNGGSISVTGKYKKSWQDDRGTALNKVICNVSTMLTAV